ncbi:hypothetical protein NGF19_11505 [Streptomyces sp. RY43-2]|uniref:Transmembrane protein n=1 Tax=Streptomyces macrolidinus TaxID=2952607 RepID=A0ABT0ZCW4_9ACTN|nr:hypothetical protein [Streptomyces macrolidinus]MCN9241406.1 hypothetical protein [Streptomyces macrolidinus]
MTAADENGTDEQARLRQSADRMDNWSKAWIMLAMLAWAWFAYLMLASYGPEVSSWSSTAQQLCDAPLSNPFPQSDKCRTYELHQWPAIIGVLALTTLLTVLAAATTVYTQLLTRLAEAASGPGKTGEPDAAPADEGDGEAGDVPTVR